MEKVTKLMYDLLLPILWTLCLIIGIISCATGGEATWLLVFCPLNILVLKYWLDFAKKYIH